MATRVRAGNLTAALLWVALLELLVNRVACRLFLPRTTVSGAARGSTAARLVSDAGPFLFHLTGVLALFVLVTAMVGLLRRGELFPRPVRFTVVLIGSVFWILALQAVVRGQPGARFFLPMETAYAFLSLFIFAATLGAPLRRRTRVGLLLLVAPGILHVLALIGERSGWFRGGGARGLGVLAEVAMLAGGILAPIFWSRLPFARRPWRLPLLIASALTALFGVLLVTRLDLLQAAALVGLRVELPDPGTVLGVAHVMALFGWAFAVMQLLLHRGPARLVGYGLLLVAVAGPQAGSPVELTLALIGLLAAAVGELRVATADGQTAVAAPQSPGDWKAFVGRVAGAASDAAAPDGAPPEAVVVQEDDLEVSRIRAYRRGRPVGVRFLRRRGRVVEYEAVVGEPGRASPDATIERHRSWLARSPEQRLPLPRMRTGDATFDQKFSVHGKAPLADEGLRRRFAAQGAGVVSLWSGAAARYRALSDGDSSGVVDGPLNGQFQGSEPVDAVIADLDRLADLLEAEAGPGA